jgi:8-oxo-dGTP pyrophosphatase MutT (NUDIX family)
VKRLPNQDRIAQLSRRLEPLGNEQDANASVALIMSPEKEDFAILFVRRIENHSDPWSGQIGLPGGKREIHDKNLQECVIREAFEETEIDLHNGRFLGLLRPIQPANKQGLLVLPFVILFQNKPLIKLSEKELDSFFWVSLQQLNRSRKTIKTGSLRVPAYIVGKNVIWGLTYRIIESLFHKLWANSSFMQIALPREFWNASTTLY